MGLPQDNAEAYRDGLAAHLRRQPAREPAPGPRHGRRQRALSGHRGLVNALVAVNKPFTLMAYPNRTHCICEGDAAPACTCTRCLPATSNRTCRPKGVTSIVPPGGRLGCATHAARRRLPRAGRHQLLPPAQRHDPVAAAGDLSDPQDELRARLRPDRPHHARLPAHRVAAAAAGRALHRPPPDAVLAAAGMGFTLVGLLLPRLRRAPTAACCSRRRWSGSARRCSTRNPRAWPGMASGGRHGLAQSLFQVGGNAGSALGPLLAAFVVVPRGQPSLAWFSVAALLAHRRAVERRRAGTGRHRAAHAAAARGRRRAHPTAVAGRGAVGARACCSC